MVTCMATVAMFTRCDYQSDSRRDQSQSHDNCNTVKKGAVNGVPCLLVPVGLRLAPPTATTITASTTTTTAASAAATALLKAAASPALLRAPTTGVAISTLHLVRSLAARVTRLTSSLSHHQQHLHCRQLSNTHTRLTALFQDYPGQPVPER